MTREELVKQKAQEFASSGEFAPSLTECFIAGAEWADGHPKKSIKDQLKAVLTANGRYAGSSTTAQLLRELADEWDD